MSWWKKLERLEKARAGNAKKEVLGEIIGDKKIKRIMQTILDPNITYGIIPDEIDGEGKAKRVGRLKDFWALAKKLQDRELTGNKARDSVEAFLTDSDPVQSKWFRRILLKSLECNAGTRLIRASLGGSDIIATSASVNVNFRGCMLADDVPGDDDAEKFEYLKDFYPFYVEPKLDGLRVVFLVNKGKVAGFTRRGINIDRYGDFSKVKSQIAWKGTWLVDTEAFTTNWGSSSSLLKNVSKNKLGLNFMIIDVVDLSRPDLNLEARKKIVKEKIGEGLANFKPIDYITANNQKDFEKAMKKWIGRYEGVMMKIPESKYEYKRGILWMKWKPFKDITVRIIGFDEGEGRHEGRLGTLICVRMDNKVEVRVGGGLLDSHRDAIWKDQKWWKYKKIDIKVQLVADEAEFAVRHPNVVRVNDDPDPKKSIKIRWDT